MPDKGTIFLDETGETKPSLQVKLLRILQNKGIGTVGEMRLKKIDTRLASYLPHGNQLQNKSG